MTTSWLEERIEELQAAAAFCTRLPLPAAALSAGALSRAVWAFPLAGLVVGLIGAAAYAVSRRLGLPPWPAAALTVAATLLVTGALHEDGLADTADGFGGGAEREQKLAIMRDSRIGVYGVCALALSILIRVSALASLGAPSLVVPALIAAHGAARAVLPAFMFFVPPARADGLSAGAGVPPRGSVAAAALLGLVLLVLCLGFGHGLAALILLAIVAALLAWLSLSQIGGQTGDVLGAVEQASEIVVLLVVLTA